MKITKTFWKTEIEISPEEIRNMLINLPSAKLRGRLYVMMDNVFKYFSKILK